MDIGQRIVWRHTGGAGTVIAAFGSSAYVQMDGSTLTELVSVSELSVHV